MADDTPKPRRKPGPKPGSEGARRTGFAVDPERARRAGKVGAARVLERYGRAHFQQIGVTGGRKLVETLGKEHLAAIGRVGGAKAKALRDQQDASILDQG